MHSPQSIEAQLQRILPRVEKPARYVGGELNQICKSWTEVPLRIALGFPDLYDLGMPNTGLAILYDIVNRQPDMLAERVYSPWSDMEAELRKHGLPLYSLETMHPIREFDILGLSLPYESVYTNVLTMLDLAGIPLLSAERSPDDPLVIAGGHATFNPEPMAAFIDAFAIGEGEELILDVARAVREWKKTQHDRPALHLKLAAIPGVYVPSLYEATYGQDGSVAEVRALCPEASLPVRKRIVAQLPPPVTNFLVPNLETVHNRVTLEIMRGCTRGCRFCHAGMVTRPVRERGVSEVVDAMEVALAQTGFSEVGLLSLSSSDYTHVLELVKAVKKRAGSRPLNISLPSLRIESFSVELMEALEGTSRRGGFTLAPEAASERMREIINKPVSTEQLLSTAKEIFSRGWHTIKLYFMIGHPEERLADVEAIAELAKAVLRVGRENHGPRAKVHVGVSTFIPKPHTPFQWVPCDTRDQIQAKQHLLTQRLRDKSIKLNWNDIDESMLEALLSRGDRRLGAVILRAWRSGARFDAWHEHLRFDLWLEALAANGLDLAFYTHRERRSDEVLPWDHIDIAVTKDFLLEDRRWSQEGRTRVDCRNKCFACGILPKFKEVRRAHPGPEWQCPEVGAAAKKAGISSPQLATRPAS